MYNTDIEIEKINQYILENKRRFNIEIGDEIRKNRINQEMSIKTFSERTLMSPYYINQVEKGINGLTLLKFITICNALEIEPKVILDIFLYGPKKNDDILYNKLQEGKNISENILKYIKMK